MGTVVTRTITTGMGRNRINNIHHINPDTGKPGRNQTGNGPLYNLPHIRQ